MDYHQIVLLHRILVSLFLLHYVIKAGLLLAGNKDGLASYTAKTRIAEMVLALSFMLTGLYLVIKGPELSMLMWVKILTVFASIPVAIIGFKRGNKMIALLAVVMLFAAYGMAEIDHAHYKKEDKAAVDTSKDASPVAIGNALYTTKCVACHGDHGDAGLAGAKNLRITQLTDDQQKDIIKRGKGGMSAFPDLSDNQLNGLVAYIKTLKQ